MRLTLRTLLAYLDDILDPADKEELTKKIESSEFAGDLILRTRDTMRRLRLSAPQVVGTGMGLDPNTVAEYLDNALAPDQVGDFERICLESDMHLAEVASTHHVLTMVLGSPADVEPAARARMYTIPQQIAQWRQQFVEGAHPSVGAAAAAPQVMSNVVDGGNASAAGRRTTEVPEYLRTSAWSRYGGWLAGLAALAVVGAAFLLNSGARDWFGGNQQVAESHRAAPSGAIADEVSRGSSDDSSAAAPTVESGETPLPVPEAAPESGLASSDVPGGPTLGAASEAAPIDRSMSPPPVHTPGVAPIGTTATGGEGPYDVASDTSSDPGASESLAASGNRDATLVEPGTAPPPAASEPAMADPSVAGAGELAVTPNPFTTLPPQGDLPGGSPFAPFDETAQPGSGETSAPMTDVAPDAIAADEPPAPVDGAATTPDRYGTSTAPTAVPSAEAMSDGSALSTADGGTATVAPETNAESSDATMRLADRGTSGTIIEDDAEIDLSDPAAMGDADGVKIPDLGTYLGGKTVLLRWNEGSGAWYRVAPRSGVLAGERLLALPEFRPKVTFGSGIHMDLSGGTQVLVDRATEQDASNLPSARADVPKIEVLYGRVVLLNTAEGANSVRLVFGADMVDVELERNATLGIEVERKFELGTDPRNKEAALSVALYAPEGGVTWRDAGGEKQIAEASQWTVDGGKMSEINSNPAIPEWIDHEPLVHRSEQLYGAPVVEQTLTTDRPAGEQLLELFAGGERKRKEVKSLATRSSIHVGLFVPFIEALRDPQQRPNWENHIETLRAAMSLDADSAEAVWKALVDQRGEAAAKDLYEMLCGYKVEQVGSTQEEVEAGILPTLIDRLENDSLDYRVLACQNLAELTGKRLMRNPAANETERGLNVRQWRRRMESGELVRRE